ncbi:MAG: AMP-binding protein [Bacteroidales bacterium]|nr:AMP-binding protein [Bacteroidales bacterium]
MKHTIIDLFEQSVKKYSDNTYLWENTTGTFEPTTYSQLHQLVYRYGAGLVKLGVKPKDSVALLSEGRNLWIASELAMFYAGAMSIPLSVKLEESNDLIFRLIHGEVSTIIVSSRELKKIRLIKDQLPKVERIVVLDQLDEYENLEIPLSDVLKLGDEYLAETKLEDFLKIGQAIQNDDVATISYTSGTTADPKGVMLTHRNYTANVEQALTCVDVKTEWTMLILLPLDHCFAHVVGMYAMMHEGASLATVPQGRSQIEALRNIPKSIQAVKPHIMLSVPSLAKSFKKNIETTVAKGGKTTQKLFNFALNLSIKYNKEGWNKGKGLWILAKPLISLFDKLVFSKVRMGLGGRMQFFIGGGALLDIDLQKFYYAIGIPMFQGYGLSESTPVISTNTPPLHRLGSSGILVKPMDLKICDEKGEEVPVGQSGEIVIRGENVMKGYWKNPKATAETVKDGWLYTGDMGYMHPEGFLYVLGRFKSLLISSDGEKYSPEGIEESIVQNSKIIQNIMLHNNQNPYTICVVQVDKSMVARGEEGLHQIKAELDKYRSGGQFAGTFPERWLPTTFILADEPFSEQNRMINSSLKLVRKAVEKCYGDRMNAAYVNKNYVNEANLKAIDNGM